EAGGRRSAGLSVSGGPEPHDRRARSLRRAGSRRALRGRLRPGHRRRPAATGGDAPRRRRHRLPHPRAAARARGRATAAAGRAQVGRRHVGRHPRRVRPGRGEPRRGPARADRCLPRPWPDDRRFLRRRQLRVVAGHHQRRRLRLGHRLLPGLQCRSYGARPPALLRLARGGRRGAAHRQVQPSDRAAAPGLALRGRVPRVRGRPQRPAGHPRRRRGVARAGV
ncbi:MAG: serine esterase, putative, partial [uncultured Nocardioidaceae bacterium]